MSAELVVALDTNKPERARILARDLRGHADWVKVGLELFVSAGPDVVGMLKDLGFKVFLDLKFFDIPNTVMSACRQAARLGVDMVNVHALGGARMAEAALAGLEEGSTGARPLLLAVTVLTSMGSDDMDILGGGEPADMAHHLALKAKALYFDGVVCSPLEVPAIKADAGSGFVCLTPGIRPDIGDTQDQRRVATPGEAVRLGSDYLVVGRPITGADDPAGAARAIRAMMLP